MFTIKQESLFTISKNRCSRSTRITVHDGREYPGISYFDMQGAFVKRIPLPAGYYERMVRDRDDALIAFAGEGLGTRMVRIRGDAIEQHVIPVTISSLVFHVLVDDFGLFFDISGAIDLPQLSSLEQCDACVLKEVQNNFKQIKWVRFNRDCFQCELKSSKGATIQGVRYRIVYEGEKGEKPSLIIGNQKINLDHIHNNGGTHIEQVDKNGTAWVKQSFFSDNDGVITHLWKISSTGDIQAIYQLPKESPDNYVQHSITISEEGQVYMMRGQSEGLIFDSLSPLPPAEKALFFKNTPAPLYQ